MKAEGYNVTANYAPLATLIGFRGEGRAGGIPLMAHRLDLHNRTDSVREAVRGTRRTDRSIGNRIKFEIAKYRYFMSRKLSCL